jgi:hypothetical protein
LSILVVKSDNIAARELMHHSQKSPPKLKWGGSRLFRFNVLKEFRVVNFKPFCNLVCQKPAVDDAKARCTHVHDQLLLSGEVHDEANHY